jgi:hypothetical protein
MAGCGELYLIAPIIHPCLKTAINSAPVILKKYASGLRPVPLIIKDIKLIKTLIKLKHTQ